MGLSSETPSYIARLLGALLVTSCSLNSVMAYSLDPNSTDSVKEIAKEMTDDMLSFYNGNLPGGTPGLLPVPYYWWEAGAMMGALVEYWYYTEDEEYVELTKQGLQFQVGPNKDYMPPNQTMTEGNDDQGFWAMAVMSAAEYNFPAPAANEPSWLALAQAVFNTQAPRWDTEYCGGGLRWQIFQWNKGWDYKNSISQGTFFALAARLALYTGNQTYADWAVKTWDWMVNLELITPDTYYVYDGGHIHDNCTEIVGYQWSYNAAVFILGAAAMYNHTEDDAWKQRLDNLLEGAKIFFTGPSNDIMTEVACERVDHCNVDQRSFKAYLSRWLAAITKWAPHTHDVVMPYLRASAVQAAAQCTGGSNGKLCGLKWVDGQWDGSTGVGQQMAAMEVTLSCMIKDRRPAYRADNGGESQGNPSAGGDDMGRTTTADEHAPVSTKDRDGAGIITVIVLASLLTSLVWMFLDEVSDKSAVTQVREFPRSLSSALGAFVYGRNVEETADTSASVAAAAAAAGARRLQKRSSNTPCEKTIRLSDQSIASTSIRVSRVRTTTSNRHARKSSTMPIGWPHNPSLRGNRNSDTSSSRKTSMHGVVVVNHSRPYSARGQKRRKDATPPTAYI